MGFPVPHLRLTLTALLALTAHAAMVSQLHVLVPMRDGVHLAANIFRPGVTSPLPTILIRTPYGKGVEPTPSYQALVDHGYAVVVQDVRGRHESQGVFSPLGQEPNDGDDTLNWIAKQAWSNGKVGMQGGSYLGIAQWKVAPLNNPHLKAMFPWFSGDDDYRDRFYSTGGPMKLGHRLLWLQENMRDYDLPEADFHRYIWTLPLRQADAAAIGRRSQLFQQALDHPDYDAYWQAMSVQRQLKNVTVPVFSVGGWYDNYVQSDLDAFTTLQKVNPANRILIGPWPHNFSRFEGVDFGPDARVSLSRMQLEWFDRWLKGKEPSSASHPPLRIFVMGANQWRDENEWPIARTQSMRFYLDSTGRANTLNGNGELTSQPPTHSQKHDPPDTYIYDPHNPVLTRGGAVCCTPSLFPWGPLDQRIVEKRDDVLVYTTAPLTTDMEVTGNIQVMLFAASSALDTDFSAKLVDVFPDGLARNLTDGMLRARYRNSLSKQDLLKPDEIAKFRIDAGVTSNLFRKGHRIRLEISSSNFPRFDRNPNTGRPVADEVELRPAKQVVYHDRKHASYLLLPVIPVEHKNETLLRSPAKAQSQAQQLTPTHRAR